MDLLDRLLGHDAWTTRRLLRCCAGLTDAQLDREFDLGLRTVRATLHHVVGNMEVWSLLMEGRPVRASLAARPQGRSVPELTARLERAAADLARIARGVADRDGWDATFVDTLDEPPTEKTLGGGIAHVLTHSMHHRGQVIHMLRRLGVADVPEGDALTWEQEAARELGSAPAVRLRNVTEGDLAVLFEHQRDPAAVRMAAFTGKDPGDRAAFEARWRRLLGDGTVVAKTILLGGRVAGHIVKFEEDGKPEVTYWIDRDLWGRGIATQALSELLRHVPVRPLYARAAADNLGSIRVLTRCGFRVVGTGRGFANARGVEVEEVVLELAP